MIRLAAVALLLSAALAANADTQGPAMSRNLLANPTFEFHALGPHRTGRADGYMSRNVAFWNTDAWGDITVIRESHAPVEIRPGFSAGNLVSIQPGKRFWQFFTLPEAGLGHGEALSLLVYGNQPAAGALKASVRLMKLDSEDGTWNPKDFGMPRDESFPRHSRGELVVARSYDATSDQTGPVELRIENALIEGKVTIGPDSHSDDINTVGIEVLFENTSADQPVWVWFPTLCVGKAAQARLLPGRQVQPYYRGIPRTIQKLWKGEPLHIILMGSSIDRGSANPPMYLYDEDPNSPTFKQPKAEGAFNAELVGRPDLDGYIGWWQHYFDYAGRLRLELMRKFDLPVNKLLLNFMACDGSCVGEAHSGLADYCSLAIPPDENMNGHKKGKSWQELYPDLFARPEGPRPDLVIFGSGANEKTDTPDEIAVFEATIRWIQHHYPDTEFLFCMFQNYGSYTPNTADLMALSLRYQIPFIDYGKVADDLVRWCNRYALVPKDGHPQAAAHYLWFKQLEKAFECWDPVEAGQPQLQLPERVHPNTYGWEGDMITFGPDSPRIRGSMFVFEDTAINCWGSVNGDPVPYVDGEKQASRRSSPNRDVRNSLFRYGRARLGDRHILELAGPEAKLTYVDAKVCPGRRFFPVDHPLWDLQGRESEPFASEWGSPCGDRQAVLSEGQAAEIDVVATDFSVAWVDAPDGGTLRVLVDGAEKAVIEANQPYTDTTGAAHYLENRRGVLNLPYGLHRVRVEVTAGTVPLLGLFAYDSRPNLSNERRVRGIATAGETVRFTRPFKARPLVLCDGGLVVQTEDSGPDFITFSGEGTGAFEAVGE